MLSNVYVEVFLSTVMVLAVFAKEAAAQQSASINADQTFETYQKRVSGKSLNDLNSLPEKVCFRGIDEEATQVSRKRLLREFDEQIFGKPATERSSEKYLEIKLGIDFLSDRYNSFDHSDKITKFLVSLIRRSNKITFTVQGAGYANPSRELANSAAISLSKMNAYSALDNVREFLQPEIMRELLPASWPTENSDTVMIQQELEAMSLDSPQENSDNPKFVTPRLPESSPAKVWNGWSTAKVDKQRIKPVWSYNDDQNRFEIEVRDKLGLAAVCSAPEATPDKVSLYDVRNGKIYLFDSSVKKWISRNGGSTSGQEFLEPKSLMANVGPLDAFLKVPDSTRTDTVTQAVAEPEVEIVAPPSPEPVERL